MVIDAVEVAREGWRRLATSARARLHWVEVVCSDPVEHRRRVEGRTGDWPGHVPPTWDTVAVATWEPFTDEQLLVDNLGGTDGHVSRVLEHLARDVDLA